MVEVTAITDDEGPRLFVEGCPHCDMWTVMVWETFARGAPEGSCTPLAGTHESINEAVEDALFWGEILGLRVQMDSDDLAYMQEMMG